MIFDSLSVEQCKFFLGHVHFAYVYQVTLYMHSSLQDQLDHNQQACTFVDCDFLVVHVFLDHVRGLHGLPIPAGPCG